MEHASPVQLSLGVTLKDDATFDNFHVEGEANTQVLKALQASSLGTDTANLLIWGAQGSGLTHLMQAAAHMAVLRQRSVQYLPMRDLLGFAAYEICDGLERVELVCLDGVDLICGNAEWERQLFHLFNNLKDAGHTLLISSHQSPPELTIELPDLRSRVLSGATFRVDSLDDYGKKHALTKRAEERGLQLSDEVATYILTRASRDTNALFNLLDRLDDASLQMQRKLTIPFVKETLGL